MANFDRAVIGSGLFGCYAAIVLAERGHTVALLDSNPGILSRASYVNQARLHTGLHYPRSLLTAMEALKSYRRFRTRFPSCIYEFEQIYGVATRNSKTSGVDFESFIKRLGIEAELVDPERWFFPGTISRAFRVEEPSFDVATLRNLLQDEISSRAEITYFPKTTVLDGSLVAGELQLLTSGDQRISAEHAVIATYAETNSVRAKLGLEALPISYELAEILLGTVSRNLNGRGFTVMDGPFWSLMPFGKTGHVSLTSVGHTPLQANPTEPRFSCQDARRDCLPEHLQDCNSCKVRPPSARVHHVQQMSMFLKCAEEFVPETSLLTVKAILRTTAVDDSRPTLVVHDKSLPVTTVFSGKVSTLLDLEAGLV